MKILINVPDLKRPGGVATLFNILGMEKAYNNISLFIIHNSTPAIFRIPYKYILFILKLTQIDLVHINPSLNQKCFFRDALFAKLTLLLSKKLIVYWHGWDEAYEHKILSNKLLLWIAKNSFLKANTSIVLGTVFKEKLRQMGYINNIVIETNTAEDKFIENQHPKRINDLLPIRLLFISRLESAKGIYIAIETLKIINSRKNKFILTIAGAGSEEEKVKILIQDQKDIEWAGYVTEESKHKLLISSHIMFFPTNHSEGMPLTLIEAMIYGLPIISRPMGGIPDIVVNGINGYILESLDPKVFAEKIENIICVPNLFNKMSKNNIEQSQQFLPTAVRERLYRLYENVAHGE